MDTAVNIADLLESGQTVTLMANIQFSLTDLYDRIESLQSERNLDIRTAAIISVDGCGLRAWVHNPEVNPCSFLDNGLLQLQ